MRFKKVNKSQQRKNKPNNKTNAQKCNKSPKINVEDNEIAALKSQHCKIDSANITSFSDFPLSTKTARGLKESNYQQPTAIQKQSIGYALQGRDVLGAAITGSGKTLAFLVPVMECLFIQKWTRMDGVGAIIISPTRELAYQIFETLKRVGKFHDFSAGLIIGGKNLKFERSRMDQCNVIICTPGRLLQHMDENPRFNCSTMQMLVLDEADRCLDMGFQQTMNGIIEHLPPQRQTLLFSATQTKSVKDLARLSLNDPVYVAAQEQSTQMVQSLNMPQTLQQNYVVVALEDKITMLWSFIKSHLKQKCIVFLASCKQVKYIYEIFCKLRPGMSIIALYGTLHQDRRMAIYNEFCRKSSVILFATDIASRGLDFPVVNWVVQLDCPEDVTAYIHRAGRTARHMAHGESLLVLMPSEETAMVEALNAEQIHINQIHIDPRRLFSPRVKMEAFLAQNLMLKESAQRAFVAYIKSVALMKNRKVFQVDALDTDAFARSLGLVTAPRVRFLQRLKKNKKKLSQSIEVNCDPAIDNNLNLNEDDACAGHKANTMSFDLPSSDDEAADSDTEESLINIKRKNHEIDDINVSVPENDEQKSSVFIPKTKQLTRAALAKRVIKKKIQANKRVLFDAETGQEIINTNRTLQSAVGKEYEAERIDVDGIDIDKAKQLLREEDKYDKQRFRQLIKARHKEEKIKSKKQQDDDKPDEQDQFGENATDAESMDDNNFSWLPDPDKIYGKHKNIGRKRQVVNSSSASSSDNEDDNKTDGDDSDNSNDDDKDQIHRPPKKLFVNKKSSLLLSDDRVKNTKIPKKKSKKITEKLTVDEAEMLAMRLLGS